LDTLIATAADPAGYRTVISRAAVARSARAIFENHPLERRFRGADTDLTFV
jgi:hypothetical protein